MERAARLAERLIALAGSLLVHYNNKSAILLHGRGLTEGAAMPFRFDLLKTIQAVAVLLRHEGTLQTSTYLRIIKLLYIAERECLDRIGRPITGDRCVAMKNGPILSGVLDLVNGHHMANATWSRFILRDGFQIKLKHDPGTSELNRFEIELLEEISDRYRDWDQWEIVELTHSFHEWKKNDPGTSSKQIPLMDILEGLGKEASYTEIVRQAEEREAVEEILRSLQS